MKTSIENFVAQCMASKKSDQYPIDFTERKFWLVLIGRSRMAVASLRVILLTVTALG